MTEPIILYVEDEENDAFLLRLSAESAGVKTPLRVVTDGAEAIEYLAGKGRYADRQQHPLPCVVLLDLKLPKVGGFEVLAWVRKQFGGKELPVVIFTSSNAQKDRERAFALGANDYLVKPVDMTRMGQTMRELNEKYVKGAYGPTQSGAGALATERIEEGKPEKQR